MNGSFTAMVHSGIASAPFARDASRSDEEAAGDSSCHRRPFRRKGADQNWGSDSPCTASMSSSTFTVVPIAATPARTIAL